MSFHFIVVATLVIVLVLVLVTSTLLCLASLFSPLLLSDSVRFILNLFLPFSICLSFITIMTRVRVCPLFVGLAGSLFLSLVSPLPSV